jgi:hypothetical protein
MGQRYLRKWRISDITLVKYHPIRPDRLMTVFKVCEGVTVFLRSIVPYKITKITSEIFFDRKPSISSQSYQTVQYNTT